MRASSPRIHERGDALRPQRRSARGERVLVEFVSANPTGPLHVGHGRQAAYGATLANLLARGRLRRSSASTTSTTPGGRWTSSPSAPGCATSRACGETAAVSRQRLPRRLRARHRRAAARRGRQRRCSRPAARGARRPAAGRAGRRQGGLHRRADRARARADRRRRLPHRARAVAAADARATSATTWPSSACDFDRWYSERALRRQRRHRSRARSGSRARGACSARTARCGSAPREFGDEKDRVVVRENGQKTYFASDIAYHLDKRERGFDAPDRRARRRSPRLRRAGARRTRGHGRAGRVPGSDADPVRQPVPRRREDADGQARGAVRHAAAAARGSRQRCLPLLLPDAQPRPAARLRSRARQVAQQREPGVLHPVRARARRERAEAARRARPRLRSRRGPRRLRAARRASTSRRVLQLAGALSEVLEQAAVNRAPHALVHYLRELANAFHTYYNAETLHRDGRRAAQRAPRAGARRAAGDAQRPDAARASPPRRACEPASSARATTSPRSAARSTSRRDCATSAAARWWAWCWRACASSTWAASAQRRAMRRRRAAPRAAPRRARRRRGGHGAAAAEKYDFYEMLPNFEVVVPEKDKEVKRDLPAAAQIERPGVYVLQAGSYRNEADAERVRASSRCRGSTPRCSASPSTPTSGTACASGRSAISTSSTRCASSCRQPTWTRW